MSEWNDAVEAAAKAVECRIVGNFKPEIDTPHNHAYRTAAEDIRALKRPTHKFVPSKSGRIDTCDTCGYPSNWSDHERA